MVENTGVADSFLPFPASMSFVKISPLRSFSYMYSTALQNTSSRKTAKVHETATTFALSQGASYFSASNLLRGTPRSSRRAMPKESRHRDHGIFRAIT